MIGILGGMGTQAGLDFCNIYLSSSFISTNYENLVELYGFKSILLFSFAIILEIIFPDIAPKVHPK